MAMVRSFLDRLRMKIPEKLRMEIPDWVALKKPWEYTGPCADPAYKESMVGALEYRVHCPASAPIRASTPAAETHLIYNIAYYNRDRRNLKKHHPRQTYHLTKDQIVNHQKKDVHFLDTHGHPRAYDGRPDTYLFYNNEPHQLPGNGYQS